MAFDGITVAALVREMDRELTGGHISKIAQTEKDELLITVKNNRKNLRLVLSVNASLPLAYITDDNKPAPLTAPNFCMLLRKHLGGGKILSITQPGLERCIHLHIEHRNEMGDLCEKLLIAELMGKHSNIIFCDNSMRILDSIKHVSAQISSVREVLPGRDYFLPPSIQKKDPLTLTEDELVSILAASPAPAGKTLSSGLTGISTMMAQEILRISSVDADLPASALSDAERIHLAHTFLLAMEDVKSGRFAPCIFYRDGAPVEFSAIQSQPPEANCETVCFDTMSEVISTYYRDRDTVSRIRQKSADLRHILQTILERDYKKLDLQEKQLKDTEKKDRYRIYGELLNTYGYELSGGEKNLTCENFYTGETVTIPLDPQLTARENAQKFFDRYGKLKRTAEALEKLTLETQAEIEHLESISTALDIALKEEDLTQIRQEMMEFGFIKRHGPQGKKPRTASRPFHYISSDGFDIYVGKNNYQNEELTFKIASGSDWWFHAKKMPGSHVIVKSDGRELTDRTFEEAGALAAYYSKGRNADKVEVDYIQRRFLRKVTGGAPGFVIYHTNYSLMAQPSIPIPEAK
ncbi:MAG: NFACT family protein [Clostridium sp.]|nr:NFACT family protein [Clostridium sp.]